MSNGSTSAAVPPITDAELWLINVGFYMIGCLIGAATNLAVLITILSDKNLRSSSFFVELSFVSITRFLSTVQTVILSIYRMLKALGLVNSILGRWECYSLFTVLMHYAQVDLTFLLFISFDRMVAIAKPMFYKSLTPKRVAMVFVAMYVVIVAGVHVPEFFGSMPEMVDCVSIMAPKRSVLIYIDNLVALVLSLLIVVSYAILVVFVFFKYCNHKTSSGQFEATMKKNMDILRPLLIVVASTSIFTIIPRFLFFFSSFSAAASARLVAYASLLSCIDYVAMCLALLAKSTDFRVAFKKRFYSKVIKTSRVTPIDQRS